MKQIEIIAQEIALCPSLWRIILPDGSHGRIKYRWGILSMIKNEGKAMFDSSIEEEQIGDDFDGCIDLEQVVEWLTKKGYHVNYQNCLDLTNENH